MRRDFLSMFRHRAVPALKAAATGGDIRPLRAVAAALAPLVVLAFQWPLWFLIEPRSWLLFLPAVFIAGWIGNRFSGYFATLLSVVIAWWFFVPPQFSLDKSFETYVFTATFLGVGVLFTEVQQRSRLARQRSAVALETARRALADLESAQRSLRELVELSPDGIFIADISSGRFLDVNSAGCQMVGRRHEDIVGMTVADLLAPEVAPRLEASRQRQLAGGREIGEWALLHADGHRVPVEINARILPGGRWNAVARDISERRRTEAQRRQAAMVFDSTNEAILITDADRCIVQVNRAYESIAGYSADESLGRDPRIMQSGLHGKDFFRQIWASLQRTGQWQGEIWNRRKNGELYPAWENISVIRDGTGRVTHYVAVMADISAIKQAEERLAHLAHHDALTGLPNRLRLDASIEGAIHHAERSRESFAVLFLDLDRFKLVNDTLGHPVGDLMLKTVAERLKGCVRAEDTVARLGGDEFVIVLAEAGSADGIGHVASKLVAAMREPITVNGHELGISTSIGISLYPTDGSCAEELLKAADTALYRAKEHGRDTYEFYSAEMTASAIERVSLEARLRRALGRDELWLCYQPQYSIATGSMSGMEVLLRWTDPAEGAIEPARFIPVAEESGLIDAVGTWVIEHAFAQLRAWLDQGLAPGRIAINVSGRQVLYGHVVEALHRLLQEHRLRPNGVHIELEMTESVLQSTQRSLEVLERVRALGVQVAIDDFGTGFSSLGVLKHLPIDAVKIDKLFTLGTPGDVDCAAITRAVVAMGQSLGLRVVAEGVERQEQLEFLRGLGCDEAQGYFLGRPMPGEELAALLRQRPRGAPIPA